MYDILTNGIFQSSMGWWVVYNLKWIFDLILNQLCRFLTYLVTNISLKVIYLQARSMIQDVVVSILLQLFQLHEYIYRKTNFRLFWQFCNLSLLSTISIIMWCDAMLRCAGDCDPDCVIIMLILFVFTPD